VFDSIGIYFSTNDFLYQKEKLRQSKPQLFLDTLGLQPAREWQRVSLIYTASGEENFIAIGDFKQRGHALTGRPDLGKDYYFFIDSISLTPLNPAERLCINEEVVKEEEYNFNVRHKMLDRLMYVHTKNPPPVTPGPKTALLRIDTLVVPDVLFATNSYTLGEKAKDLLSTYASRLQSLQVDSVVVEGHTDSQGAAAANQLLSKARAEAVAAFLEPVVKSPLSAKAFASEKPVGDNRTAEGRQKNRRVEIYMYIRE
jgi:outer membrane protein OmpA-like peptidoglycan-associated protein